MSAPRQECVLLRIGIRSADGSILDRAAAEELVAHLNSPDHPLVRDRRITIKTDSGIVGFAVGGRIEGDDVIATIELSP